MQNKIKYASLIVLFALCVLQLKAQEKTYRFSTNNPKALKFYKKAEDAYIHHENQRALRFLDKSLEKDEAFIEAYLLMGDIYVEQEQKEKAIEVYNIVLSIDTAFFPKVYYFLGLLYLDTKQYQEAATKFYSYLKFDDQSPAMRELATTMMQRARLLSDFYENPVPFDPVNVGPGINTLANEYMNSISADNEILFFTRRMVDTNRKKNRDYLENIYQARKDSGQWKNASMLERLNDYHGRVGALTLSPDRKYLFFVACHAPDGEGSCDLYYSMKEGDHWGEARNLGKMINTASWESQPTFASDGRTLYFASNRSGGYGSSDIWKSVLQHDGTWNKPVNLGLPINTRGEEMAPFIHPDNKTLYFSSDGHSGLGKADLFLSRLQTDSTWLKPVNLGFPINTDSDEINIIIDAEGKNGYISSDKLGGYGKHDIYYFELYDKIRPESVTYMKGIVFDAETKERLNASFELIDIEKDKKIVESFSDPETGEFLVVIPPNRNYALNVSKKGYLFYSDNFQLKGFHAKMDPFVKNVFLKPIKQGETVVLKNIFFDYDKYDLRPESITELKKIIEFMKQNPEVEIEIGGHTDNRGGSEYNDKLSKDRAKAVYDYLIEHDIPQKRLSYKGYGFNQPIDTNTTDEGRANNRRTEFKIIRIGR